jgi:hypothetical protein
MLLYLDVATTIKTPATENGMDFVKCCCKETNIVTKHLIDVSFVQICAEIDSRRRDC